MLLSILFLLTALISCGDGANEAKDIPPMPRDTDLELWIGEEKSDSRLSGMVEKDGVYYGSKYSSEVTDGFGNSEKIKNYVTYSFGGYPLNTDRPLRVTEIVITDPEVSFAGITLSTDAHEAAKQLLRLDYEVLDLDDRSFKGRYNSLSLEFLQNERIVISVKSEIDPKLLTEYEALPKPETNLEFWVGENVDDFDFSKHVEDVGWMGATGYFGLGYLPTYDENGGQLDPEKSVLYLVTRFPDYSSESRHISEIRITDPLVHAYGITLNTPNEDAARGLEEAGFAVKLTTENGEITEVNAELGEYFVRFSRGSRFTIGFKVRNSYGWDF